MQPAEVLVGAAAAGAGIVALGRRGGLHIVQRDPQRAFSEPQRQAIFARAGGRCEHVAALGLRCRALPSHADHVYPWSKGGATALANAQALCARHNLQKGSSVPSAWYRHRLERRRRSYFPPDEPAAISWRVGAGR